MSDWINPKDRASMFIEWCALHGFGIQGWPDGAHDQLVAHMQAMYVAGRVAGGRAAEDEKAWRAVCEDRGHHEWYLSNGETFCRQCGRREQSGQRGLS